MLDDITKKNLFLCNSVFQEVKTVSNSALKRGFGFVQINNYLRNLRPYLDNMALFCNEYFDADIKFDSSNVNDLLGVASICKRQIDCIDNAISKHIGFDDVNINFASDENMMMLGNLLSEIDKQPKKQAYLNKYFMRGMFEAAAMLMLYKKQNTSNKMVYYLSKAGVVDNIVDTLVARGLSVDDNVEKDLLEAISLRCESLCFSKQKVTEEQVENILVNSVHQCMEVDKNILQDVVNQQKGVLFNIIKKTKNQMVENNKAFRNLSLFAQNVNPVPHDNAEKMIYLSRLDRDVMLYENILSSEYVLPDYLQCYRDDKEFKNVVASMEYWENYEKQSDNFDKRLLIENVGKMHLRWLNALSVDMENNNKIFASIASEENVVFDDKNIADKQKLLDFAEDLVVASQYSEKYLNLILNDTGVNVETLDVLRKKDEWSMQDINLLGEFFFEVEQKFDENQDVIKSFVEVDYDKVLDVVISMPHGKEKIDALNCVSRVFDLASDGLSDNLGYVCGDIYQNVRHNPDNDNMFKDFLQEGKHLYSELKDVEVDDLFDKLKQGVVMAYVVPTYKNITIKDDALNIATSLVDDFDNYSTDTQAFITSLTKYYVDKTLPYCKEEAENGIYSSDLQKKLEYYDDICSTLDYIDDVQELIDGDFINEKKMLLEYNKFKALKGKYELPKNYDLMLAAKIYGQKKYHC